MTEIHGIYSLALEARVHWALYRVSLVAEDQVKAEEHLSQALSYAGKSGNEAGHSNDAVACPCLLSDVPELAHAWQIPYSSRVTKRQTLRTRDGIKAWLEPMAADCQRRCGLVYELFTRWFSEEVDRNIRQIEEPFQALAMDVACEIGYVGKEELAQMQEEFEESGDCPLTGIDPWCCPCGRHE